MFLRIKNNDSLIKNSNIFLLGLAFFLIFTAFNSMGNFQTILIANAKNESSDGYVEGFEGDGYYALAIIYVSSAFFNRLAAPVVWFVGLKWTLVVASSFYAMYIASFFLLEDGLLYTGAVLVGLGAAMLWPAQGAFLTMNSTPETLARNSGIFSAMMLTSLVAGNTISYTQFNHVEDIDHDMRTTFVAILCAIGCCGTLVLTLLRQPQSGATTQQKQQSSPWEAIKLSFTMFGLSDMRFLAVYFLYMGIELTFGSGVYGACLGFTKSFPSSKGLTALHGIVNGLGGISCGLLLAFFGRHTMRYGRYPVVAAGMVAQFVAYIMIFINIPNDAPMGETDSEAIVVVPSNKILALTASFLLGFGNSSFITQITSLLGLAFRGSEQATPAFAVYKLVQSSAAAVAFFYAGHVPLYYHLGMLWVVGVLGVGAFVKVDLGVLKRTVKTEEVDQTCDKQSVTKF